ncbi:MAG: hypothetical protein B6242_11945 [Anaerolineaceae bacterium 4572_78]|nr:MAG: hypothetical protein B6242_11945 [Anaerolineaceae bacterium 4572_78]
MTTSIIKLVDDLPEKNLTTRMLNGLDFVIPGEWENIVGFDNTIQKVVGVTDQSTISAIRNRSTELFNDPKLGYQSAMKVYRTVDRVDSTLAKAALASKIGERFRLFSFLSKITPKADTTQAMDLAMKIAAELLAFTYIHGLPRNVQGIKDFTSGLTDYSGSSLMRMAALVSVDGLVPLGPDFTNKTLSTLRGISVSDVENNIAYKTIGNLIPGNDAGGKLSFISNTLDSAQGWLNNFVSSKNLSVDKVMDSIQGYVDIADSSLDYVAAFLDMATNYYEHTGTQAIARHVIQEAAKDI